jgi:hypothetical protein
MIMRLHPLASEDDHVYIIDDAEIDLLIVDAAAYEARGQAIIKRTRGLRRVFSFGQMDGVTDILLEINSTKPAPLVDESNFDASLYRQDPWPAEGSYVDPPHIRHGIGQPRSSLRL